MSRKPKEVVVSLTKEMHSRSTELARSRTAQARHIERAAIILNFAEGHAASTGNAARQ
jgi:hypothetical protein